jgi:hypothetical protein
MYSRNAAVSDADGGLATATALTNAFADVPHSAAISRIICHHSGSSRTLVGWPPTKIEAGVRYATIGHVWVEHAEIMAPPVYSSK